MNRKLNLKKLSTMTTTCQTARQFSQNSCTVDFLASSRINTSPLISPSIATARQIDINLISEQKFQKHHLVSTDDENVYSLKIIPSQEKNDFVLKNIEFIFEYEQIFEEGIRFGRLNYIKSIMKNFRRAKKEQVFNKTITQDIVNDIDLTIESYKSSLQTTIICSSEKIMGNKINQQINQMKADYKLLFGEEKVFENMIFNKWQLYPNGLKINFQQEQYLSTFVRMINQIISKQ